MRHWAEVLAEISDIFSNMSEEERNEAMENLLENCVKYSISKNCSQTNWIARDLFAEVLEEDNIHELFDS